MKKFIRAFTLAEVLLVLGIIGVVAALTIPAVINKAAHAQHVSGLKKAWNTIKRVESDSFLANGEFVDWDRSTAPSVHFERYYKPYFDVLVDCGTADNGCFADEYFYLNGEKIPGGFNSTPNAYRFVTADGVAVMYASDSLDAASGKIGIFVIDTNGKKKPNKLGRDTFYFPVFYKSGVEPGGAYDETTNARIPSKVVDEVCSIADASHRDYCAVKVLAEGKMNY